MNNKDIRFLLKKYMACRQIQDFKELAKLTGIKYQTLLDHLDNPGLFRKYELSEIFNVLQVSSEDQILILSN